MNKLLDVLFRIIIVLGITVVLYLIWAFVWRMLYLPIRNKDVILKEREDARKDLLEIQAAKSIEWDKYKNLTEELDKLRKAHFQEKANNEKLKEETVKLQLDKENLIAANKTLKETKAKDKDKK